MKLKDYYLKLPIDVSSERIIFSNLNGIDLAAPESFWDYLDIDKSDMVNGCGPSGFGDFLIPNKVYGLSIKPACMIHDWMFTIFNCEKGFKVANQVFFDNMNRINKKNTKSNFLWWLRKRRIMKYFLAVKYFGRQFYYDAHVGLYNNEEVYK